MPYLSFEQIKKYTMKQYSLIVALHICLLALFSIGAYALFRAELWFSSLITFLFFSGTGIHLYHMQIKQLRMMRQLTDSLHYNDMMQAFHPPYKNKLMAEMAKDLSETLQAFRSRLLKEEVKHQYYESLLNKVDTAVLVADMSGNIEWMNRAAIDRWGTKTGQPEEHPFRTGAERNGSLAEADSCPYSRDHELHYAHHLPFRDLKRTWVAHDLGECCR